MERQTSRPDRVAELETEVAALRVANARLAEAVAARDAFLVVAAHELRNPMTPIVGRLALLRQAAERPDATAGDLARRTGEVQWLVTLFMKRATTLLDISRLTTSGFRPQLEPVEVGAVAQAVIETFTPLARYGGSTLALEAKAGGAVVLADRLSLEQVLDNLVSNAIKYAPGSPIALRVMPDPTRGVACIEVHDAGPGIPAEAQARIFDRFERAVAPGASAGGFGVGLWIVRRLVEAMEGRIEIESTPGAGSTFRIELPLFPARNPA